MPRIRYMDGARNEWIKTTGVLTASSAVAALPAAASQSPDRSYVWRSVAGTGVHTLDIDFGSSQSPTSVAVANVKLVGTGALLLYTGATPGAETTLVATLPTQDRDTRTTFAFFNATAGRYWRLKWTNPTAASDYAEVGYVHLGTYFEPTINPVVPAEIQRVDPSVASESIDGQASYARRSKYFSGRWQFRGIPEAQLDSYRLMFDALGVSGPFFQVLDTAVSWSSWLALLAGPLEVGLESLAGRYALGQAWREVR